jgi:hypothetical protein
LLPPGTAVCEHYDPYVTGEASLLGMLRDSYTGRRSYAEGIEALSSVLDVFEEHGDRRGQALCLLKIGRAYLALGQADPAQEYLQRAFPIFGELGLTAHEDMTIRTLSECHPCPCDRPPVFAPRRCSVPHRRRCREGAVAARRSPKSLPEGNRVRRADNRHVLRSSAGIMSTGTRRFTLSLSSLVGWVRPGTPGNGW